MQTKAANDRPTGAWGWLNKTAKTIVRILLPAVLPVLIASCATPLTAPPPVSDSTNPNYIIGPGDTLEIFVWRNPEVSTTLPVRPDGKISTPLVEDMLASGKTPTELARNIESQLAAYIKEPLVTVMVRGFVGPYSQQIRVVGAAAEPRELPYRANMTLLDLMIAVGGLTDIAAGNRASLIRVVDGKQQQYGVRLDDLVRDGNISANAKVQPGDILIIPEAWF